jgi:hypothetical protein
MAAQAHLSNRLSRAWYGASIAEFVHADPDAVVGRLLAIGPMSPGIAIFRVLAWDGTAIVLAVNG